MYDLNVAAAKPREAIKVTLPDGKVIDATSWETTPLDIAKGIAKSLAETVVIAKVDDVLFDLTRPLETSCRLKFLKFDDEEGKHSSCWEGFSPSPAAGSK